MLCRTEVACLSCIGVCVCCGYWELFIAELPPLTRICIPPLVLHGTSLDMQCNGAIGGLFKEVLVLLCVCPDSCTPRYASWCRLCQ